MHALDAQHQRHQILLVVQPNLPRHFRTGAGHRLGAQAAVLHAAAHHLVNVVFRLFIIVNNEQVGVRRREMHESEQEEVFEKIAEVVEQAQTGESETTDVLLTEEETVLAEYGELYLQNTDMVGWLSIAGTNINYPVMQTPNNPNYYLKHNFEKEYSDLGTPYVQENCDLLTSDNLVIYGHHIKGQKMFGALENYKSKDFYEEHKTFRFDTLTKRGEYEIIAVFKTVAFCGRNSY